MRLSSSGSSRLTLALATLLLSACGGGGGGGSNTLGPPPAGSYDLQAAWAALVTHGLTSAVSLSGTAIANGSPYTFTGSGTFALSAGTSGTFNGSTAVLVTESVSATINVAGQSMLSTSSTEVFEPGTGAIAGQVNNAEYDVAGTPLAIPASIGTASVSLGSLTRYTDSTLSVPEGTIQVSVAVTQVPLDSGSNEVVRFTYNTYDASQSLVEVDTYDFVLTENSVLTFDGASAQTSQGTLTITPQ